MATRKRLFEDYDNLAYARSPSTAAKLHGGLTELHVLPMKDRKYFEGRIADDQTSMRLVGFDTLQQQEFAVNREKNEPVALQNCQIQKLHYGDKMKVMVNRSTKVASVSL